MLKEIKLLDYVDADFVPSVESSHSPIDIKVEMIRLTQLLDEFEPSPGIVKEESFDDGDKSDSCVPSRV